MYYGQKDLYFAQYLEPSDHLTLEVFRDCPGALVTRLKERGELVPFLQRHLDMLAQ